ncbi:MAG: glycosyltransferase family 1 protein [Oxalobacteraceae bacterium]|nr:glycosyltransferase family 1 protein [Oxalobacteraceae bacterium]
MPRLLIECTRTASSGLHTGIQRVVRRITDEAQRLTPNHGFESVISVVIEAGRWYALPKLMPHVREAGSQAALTCLDIEPLTIQPDDHLLLVDATWYLDAWPAIVNAIDHGAQLHVIWHDLIPLQYPEFFPKGLAPRFKHHLDQVIQHASSIQCVSATVRAQLAHYIRSTAPHKINTLPLGVQHPGADGLQSGIAPREALRAMWPAHQTTKHDDNSPLRLLAVGTLEPRKGHAILLDACEAIWRDMASNTAGAPGWQVDSLLARLQHHPELGRRLFVFHDLSDAELDWCYTRASCLVYPSFAEGYGLPIAEAGWRGVPVLLSDTGIHREVAGPKARYFAPRSAVALEQALRQYQTSARFFDPEWPEPGRFRRWRDMAATLMQSLQQTSLTTKGNHEPHH